MKVTDFIVEKAELLARLMVNGPVMIVPGDHSKGDEFSMLVWVTPRNLTSVHISLFAEHGMKMTEVIPEPDEKLRVHVVGLFDPIHACSTNE
jgi:hypothetical protein